MVRMSCFFCTHKKGVGDIEDEVRIPSTSRRSDNHPERRNGDKSLVGEVKDRDSASGGKSIGAKSFTFSELAAATENFKEVNSIGEGGFGRVYMGRLESGQAVAIKRLNLDGLQGFQEFIVEVLMLSLLHHPNLVTLIGYCSDGDQRLLVYEFMPMGSLEDHLFYAADMGREPLDWSTRLKIAVGAARGLEYLHCKANPPVIYRDLKSANILLDSGFNPRLSDFGLAKLGPVGDNTHVSTRVMGTYGYCAPEYAMSGRLTPKSDIYSFGVVLLELITGRKAIDISKKQGQQNLVAWSRPYMKDERKFLQIADPSLQGCFPARNLRHAVAITAMCLQEQPSSRPTISDIVPALEFLASQTSTLKPCKTDGNSPSVPTLSPSPSPSPSLPSLSLPSSSPSPSPSPTTSPPSPPRLWDDFLYPSARD